MIQKDYEYRDYGYIDGSAAKKPDYDVYEENKVLKAKRKYKNNRKAKFKLVVSILAVLLAGLVVVYRYALITQISYNINQTEKQYYELRNDNSKIRVQLEQDTDLTSIKQLAETKLGMRVPDKSQIVYIDVQKNDHTVVMNTKGEDTKANAKGNIFTAFISKAVGLFNLFN